MLAGSATILWRTKSGPLIQSPPTPPTSGAPTPVLVPTPAPAPTAAPTTHAPTTPHNYNRHLQHNYNASSHQCRPLRRHDRRANGRSVRSEVCHLGLDILTGFALSAPHTLALSHSGVATWTRAGSQSIVGEQAIMSQRIFWSRFCLWR